MITIFLIQRIAKKFANQFIQEFPIRSAEIGQGTVIKRALPSRQKTNDWCVVFPRSCGPSNFSGG